MIAFKTIRSLCALGSVVGLSLFISEIQEGYASPPPQVGDTRPGANKQFTPKNAPKPKSRIDNFGTPVRHSVSSIQNSNGFITYTMSGIDPTGTMYSRNMRVEPNSDGSYLITGNGINLKGEKGSDAYIVTPSYDPATNVTTYSIVGQTGLSKQVQVTGDETKLSNSNMEQIFYKINDFND